MSPSAISRNTGLVFLALTALLGVTYSMALAGPFLLDDFVNLPQAKPSSWQISDLLESAFSNHSGPLGRPVSALTFGLNYLTTGDSAIGFKVVNLVIHLFNSLLVYLLVYMLATHARDISESSRIEPFQAAIVVTFIWALHPLHMSTVMYVVQRMNLLSAFFILASIICYLSVRIEYRKKGILKWRCMLASLVFSVLAIYSKENGVLVLIYIILLELIIFQRLGNLHTIIVNHKRYSVPISMLIGSCLMYTFYVIIPGFTGGYELRDFTLEQRLFTQPGIVTDYMSQTLFPRIDEMGLYFDDISPLGRISPGFYLPLLVLAAMSLGVFLLARPAPLISFGIGVFLTSHLLESTILPLEMKFEHRNYFGSIGIIIAVVSAFYYLKILIFNRLLRNTIITVLIVFLSSQTFARSQIWKDEFSFNQFEVQRAPDSKRASSALAISLSKAGMTEKAMDEVYRIISLDPDDSYAPVQLYQICALALSNCHQELEQANNTLSYTKITKETVAILEELTANVRAGYIKNLKTSVLLDLLTITNNNPNQLLTNSYKARLQLLVSEGYLMAGNNRKATEMVMKSAALAPDNEQILTRGAEITAGVGTIEESEAILRRLETLSPTAKPVSARIAAVHDHLKQRRTVE